jgi:hypothetical protein
MFWIWLACSYLSQPMSQIVLDIAFMILPEPTNEPNGWDFWLTAIHDCQSLLRNFFLSAYKILGIKMSFRKSVTFLKRNKVLTCSTGTTHLAMYALNYIKNSSLIVIYDSLNLHITIENTYFLAIRYMYGSRQKTKKAKASKIFFWSWVNTCFAKVCLKPERFTVCVTLFAKINFFLVLSFAF